MMRLVFVSPLLTMLMVTPAYAQDSEKPFQGVSVTAIAGVDSIDPKGKADTALLYGAQVGFDLQSRNFVFGVEGEISGSNVGYRRDDVKWGAASEHAGVDYDLYAGARVGVVAGKSVMIYAKGGYLWSHGKGSFRDPVTGALIGPNAEFTETTDGLRGGVGVETRFLGKFIARVEYRYFNSSGDISRHQGVAGIGFRF